MKAAGIILALAGALAAPLALSHHSAVQFDFTKVAEFKGTVKQFAAVNPHMRMTLEVADGKGTREIKFEGHSTNNMYRNGYRKGMVNVGDVVTVRVAPLKSGEDGGYVLGATAANGEYFGARTTRAVDAEAARKQAESR
jgi:hypothetical protein